MNKTRSQKEWVISILNREGKISRNFCLQNYITRLGALVNLLNKEGWVITGGYEGKSLGRDFVYRVEKSPYKKITRYVSVLNKTIVSYEK